MHVSVLATQHANTHACGTALLRMPTAASGKVRSRGQPLVVSDDDDDDDESD